MNHDETGVIADKDKHMRELVRVPSEDEGLLRCGGVPTRPVLFVSGVCRECGTAPCRTVYHDLLLLEHSCLRLTAISRDKAEARYHDTCPPAHQINAATDRSINQSRT